MPILVQNALTTGQPRLSDHRIRPTVMHLTSRRAEPSHRRRGVLSVVIAVAGMLACATVLQYILGAS